MSAVYVGISKIEHGFGASNGEPRILCDWSDPSRSPRSTDVLSILANTPSQFNSKHTETTERYLYHILVGVTGEPMLTRSLIFVCVAEPSLDKSLAFTLLDGLQSSLNNRQDWLAIVDGLQASTSEVEKPLQSKMESTLVNSVKTLNGPGSGTSKIGALKQEVEAVKRTMESNVEAIIQRGERLDDLSDRTADLEANASSFQRTSHDVRRHMCWKNCKWNIICAIAIVLTILIIVIVVGVETGLFKGGGGSSAATTTTKPPATTIKPS